MQNKSGTFKGLKDHNIFYQCWFPDKKPKAVILIAHGFAEHSGRYSNVVDYFVARRYSIWAPDHRGHGRSDGDRASVDDFYDCIFLITYMYQKR